MNEVEIKKLENKTNSKELNTVIIDRYLLSQEEHNSILNMIKQESYIGKKPVENPKFFLVIGQTGSGKSFITSDLCKKIDNVVVIDADKYKKFRSDNDEILKNYPEYYGLLTRQDGYKHRDEMIEDATQKKYNILVEIAPGNSRRINRY